MIFKEQYSRRSCVLIYGILENNWADNDELAVEIFWDKLEVKVSQWDISRIHRIEKPLNQG